MVFLFHKILFMSRFKCREHCSVFFFQTSYLYQHGVILESIINAAVLECQNMVKELQKKTKT